LAVRLVASTDSGARLAIRFGQRDGRRAQVVRRVQARDQAVALGGLRVVRRPVSSIDLARDSPISRGSR
jgi:hypothetical protein